MHYINYHEAKQRGTLDFPIDLYHITENHPQYHMPLHWHVEFEFIRILEGDLHLYIDEQELHLPMGTVAFIPSGALHSAEPQNNCIYDCIVMDANMLMSKSDACSKFIRKIMSHELEILTFYDHNHPKILASIWALFDVLSSKPNGYQLIVLGSLYDFFGLVISANLFPEVSPYTSRNLKRVMSLKKALEFIETFYASAITLNEIASSVQMSSKYFCKFFREMTHSSPIEYLNSYRIERACYLLLTTNQSITEVAYNTGFNDLSYFIKIFKRHKGITPKQYIK